MGSMHPGRQEIFQQKLSKMPSTQLANLGRKAVEPPIALDHAVEEYRGFRLLFIFVPESSIKPVYVHGKMDQVYIRSGGTTRIASRQEIGMLMLHSHTPRWEELRASALLTDLDMMARLEIEPIFTFLERQVPTTNKERLNWMVAEKFVEREQHIDGGYVTNLGAITAAYRLEDFPDLSRKTVRVVVYGGFDKTKAKQELEGRKGYAVGFPGLLQYVMALLPKSEVIQQALRTQKAVYPEIALREIIANALIHQDFSISGSAPLIEIFDDRIEISNPGGLLPSKQLDRLIGTHPESRNQELARTFRRYKICEERGSGLIKAGNAAELYGLPPIRFFDGKSYFKVTLYSPRTFAQMSAQERLQACFQHATLKFLADDTMTNKSLRERLKMPEKQRSMVSLLIQEAIDGKLIKRADPRSKSKKFAEYIPYWA